MRSAKSVLGVIGVIVPLVYCSGLAFYFFRVGGSVEGVTQIGLGPTVLGLSAVGLLLFVPLLFKLPKLFIGSRPSSSDQARDSDEDGGFDADAVFARYMARRAAEGHAPPVPLADHADDGPRPVFGRKIVN